MPTNLPQVPKQEFVVEHYNTPISFWVKSRSVGGSSYLVVLKTDEYPWGVCQCKHFVTTVGPAQKRGERRMCYHIERARAAFDQWAIDIFYARDKNTPDE